MANLVEIPDAAAHRSFVVILKRFAEVTGKHLLVTSVSVKLQPFSLQKY